MYICISVYLYICIYVYMYICIYVYMYICIYVYMYICIYVYMYICTYVHMYIWIYVYMYICICICMCVWVSKKYNKLFKIIHCITYFFTNMIHDWSYESKKRQKTTPELHTIQTNGHRTIPKKLETTIQMVSTVKGTNYWVATDWRHPQKNQVRSGWYLIQTRQIDDHWHG